MCIRDSGKPLFGTLIALLNYGKPVLGVIDQCVLKERWKGSNGKTTFNGRPCSTDDCTSLQEAMVYATTVSYTHLTLPNHDLSKGRVLCAANAKLHSEALAALKQAPPFSRVARDAFLLGLACGVAAMAFLRGRK